MIRKIILTLVVLLFVGSAVFYLFATLNYSEGARAGTLVKLSKKGFIFKTWEGELNSYMYVGDQAAASAASISLFTFSVLKQDEQSLIAMEKAMLNGYRIKLYYKERYFKLPWNGDTKYFIYKAELIVKN